MLGSNRKKNQNKNKKRKEKSRSESPIRLTPEPGDEEKKDIEKERKEISRSESPIRLKPEPEDEEKRDIDEKKEKLESESPLLAKKVIFKGNIHNTKELEDISIEEKPLKQKFVAAARPKVTDGGSVKGLLEIQAKLQRGFTSLIESSDEFVSGRPYRLGAVVIDNATLSHVTGLTPSHPLIGDGSTFGKANSNDIVELVDKTLRATGQLDLLASIGVLDDPNWRVVVDVDYYHNRTANSIGMHKDSTGKTMWVNLSYMNKKPIVGPEYIHNPDAFLPHHEGFYLHHPKYKELKDQYREENKKNENGIEFLGSIDAFGILSFDDNVNHHSTPYLFSRGQPTIDTAKKAFEAFGVKFDIAEPYLMLKELLQSKKLEIIKPQELPSGGLNPYVVIELYGGSAKTGNEMLATLDASSDKFIGVADELKKFLKGKGDRQILINDLNGGRLSNEQIVLLYGGKPKTGSELFTNVESRDEYKHALVLDLLKENRGEDETINLKDEALQQKLIELGINMESILKQIDVYRTVASNAGPNLENFDIPKGLQRSLSNPDILAVAKKTKADNNAPRSFFRMWVGAYPINELTPSITIEG